MSNPAPYTWNGDRLTLNIRVQPRSSKDEIVGIQGNHLKIRITSPPVDGKANAHLIQFLARVFDVPKARISLLCGENGREKRLLIVAPTRLPEGLTRPV
ncbi:MAG: YggU family protein [Gammaproteobacteria bacterium]|nr:YggU family protein [Gammaproteobacteria bacterium]